MNINLNYPEVYKDYSVVEEHFDTTYMFDSICGAASSQVNGLPSKKISDPYRWLEDPDSEQTKSFVKEQNLITEQYLNSCPHTNKIKAKLTETWDFERYSCPLKYGNYYYYWHNFGLQNQSILYQLENLQSPMNSFLDPNQLNPDGLLSVRTYGFSEEGTYLCYGLSFGGSDWCELKFKVCKTGQDLPDVLKQVKFSCVTWTHDEKGVFYCMYVQTEGKTDGTETTSNKNQKLMYHRLGTPQSEDILCLERPDQPTWTINCDISDCGRYLIVTLHDGCEPNNQIFYYDLKSCEYNITKKLDVIPIVDTFEAVYEYVTNENNKFVFRTNMNAPMYKLITIDIENLDRRNWIDLVPENPLELLESSLCIHGNNLVLCHLKDVKNCLTIHDLNTGNKITDIQVPLGTIANITGRKRDSEMFIHFVSFLTPGIIYEYDFKQQIPQLKIVREAKVKNVNLDNFEVKQIFYSSKDETKIPMFIVLPKKFILDGSAPCQLYGYGGFNISITPSFSVSRLLFLIHFGGIIAVANIRGGGEYGQPWHDAGRRLNKQNSFDDFLAGAEYLISNGYTNRHKLFIQGGSNGGLLVSACANQRPDLFGAVIAQVPVCDLLRFHKFTIGHAWISDYGDPDCQKDFQVLLKYSPLHNVRVPADPNVQYPALLVLTADHDDRVVPLHSFKFIATLQDVLCRNGNRQTNPVLARIETKAGHGQGKPTTKSVQLYQVIKVQGEELVGKLLEKDIQLQINGLRIGSNFDWSNISRKLNMEDFDLAFRYVSDLVSENIKKNFKPFDGIDTIATHGGYNPLDLPEIGRPIAPPITLSTTFQQLSPGVAKYDYSRAGNYSRECLENCIAALENGDHCCVYGSGLAALGAVFQLLSHGDHILASDDLYGGSIRYLRRLTPNFQLSHTLVDMRNSDLIRKSLQPHTRLILVETPSNPLMHLVNIRDVCQMAHEYNKEIIVVVDNTFMSPYFQRPLDHGADIVLHSLTKYMNGHSDVVMGALVTRHRSDLKEKLIFLQLAAGAVPSPFDCYLCLRGLRTLSVRMRTHMRNGLIIAMMLERHPLVQKVIHPGLKSFAQNELSLKQMRGFSGMVTVYLNCSSEQTHSFVKSLKIFALAESLGGYESLIEIPSIMTHASIPAEIREQNGICDNMVRISVGLEDPRDLASDLYMGLKLIQST